MQMMLLDIYIVIAPFLFATNKIILIKSSSQHTDLSYHVQCRRYYGHRRTIRPNAKKLYSLFMNRTSTTWDAFASKVSAFQKGFMGEPNEVKPGRGEFHENPSECICEHSQVLAESTSLSQSDINTKIGKSHLNKSRGRPSESRSGDEVLDWRDLDYGENTPLNGLSKENESEYNLFTRPEDVELEELISD